MTACVNNQNENKGGVSHKVLRSVVAGVLAVSMVPTAALAVEPEGASAGLLAAGTEAQAWAGADVQFTGTYANGSWTIAEGEIFEPTSVKVLGRELSSSEYEVVYVNATEADTDFSQATGHKLVNSENTAYADTSHHGEAPIKSRGGADGSYYWAVVVEKADWADSDTQAALATVNGNTKFSDLKINVYKAVKFQLVSETTELKDVKAFEAETDTTGKVDGSYVSDESFQYTGGALKVGFKMGDEALSTGEFGVACVSSPASATVGTANVTDGYVTVDKAGTYVFTVTPSGAGSEYSGSANVTVEVAKADLDALELTMKPLAKADIDYVASTNEEGFRALTGSGSNPYNNFALDQDDYAKILADGEAFDANAAIAATLVTIDGVAVADQNAGSKKLAELQGGDGAASYVFSVTSTDTNDVTGSALVTLNVVDDTVAYSYAGSAIGTVSDSSSAINGKKGIVIDPAYGQSFNPDYLGATFAGTNKADFTYELTDEDGEKADASKPGVYDLTVTTPVFTYAGQTYAGLGTYKVEVKGAVDYSSAKTYAIYDGAYLKNSGNAAIDYTGSAIEPEVYATMDGEALAEGTDYTVELKKDGKAVDSAVELGDYTMTVKYADGDTTESFEFEIGKANVEEVDATSALFALPADGSAATPSFQGKVFDNAGKVAQTWDLAADEIDAVYYEVEWKDADETTGRKAGWYIVDQNAPIAADELTEAGHYVAQVSLLATSKYLQGGEKIMTAAGADEDSDASAVVTTGNRVVAGPVFEVSETAKFTDVDANEWYATPVYKAAELGYVNGIQGTSLFAPNADIERSQIAAILFNMAGGDSTSDPNKEFPTKFSDVDPNAWYAQAVSWASTAGVVNGYAGTDLFGTFDKATREQVAAMFYNYAKAMGKDVSVADEDAALSKVADAGTVSPWFKTAVAWAVENGVMGNGGYVSAQDCITRAEVAAMAVNFQPEALK